MAKKAKKPAGLLVVAAKVKAHCKQRGLRIGTDALAMLSGVVATVVDRAGDAALTDRRQTIKERDINLIP